MGEVNELQDDIRRTGDRQQDALFVMLVSAAFGADPWATEDFLFDKGIINNKLIEL